MSVPQLPQQEDAPKRYQRALKAESENDRLLALELYQNLLHDAPDFPNLHYRLGILLHQTTPFEAIPHYREELRYRPDFWGCRNNLALCLEQTGQYEAALAEFHKALQDCPAQAEGEQARILENIGDLFFTQNKLREGLGYFQRALALQAVNPRLQLKIARSQQRLGQILEAIQSLKKSLQLYPQSAKTWFLLGHLQAGLLQFESSYASYLIGLKMPCSNYEKALACLHMAHALSETGKIEEADAILSQGLNYEALDGLRLAKACLLPPIYRTQQDLILWRNRFANALQAFQASPFTLRDPVREVGSLPFYLPYQGENDRALLEKLSAIYQSILPPDEEKPSRSKSNRLRLGIVSHYFHKHSLMECFGNLILALPQDRFELGFFSLDPLLEDQVTLKLKQRADYWDDLPHELKAQRKEILKWHADILLYTDLGTHLPTWLLAHSRLAPLQWVLPGHPVTSGLKSIDGFVSNIWLDTPEAQAHYTEPLIRLPLMPAYVPLPQAVKTKFSRLDLGLPENKRIYLCPVSLYKIHPQMDPLFKALLDQDREGIVLMLNRPQSLLDQHLKERFYQSIGPNAERIWFVPWFTPERFLSLLSNCEVLLEPFPFGNGTTLFTAFGMGIPVVTLPGSFARGRFAHAFYEQMQLGHLVANSEKDYLEKALSWAKQKELRQAVSQAIIQAHPRLFQNPEALNTFCEALCKAHEHAR
ncbi:hypothetical protein COW36_02135 [bacterium (Candidatus Blackallbacteria) CG17_big_fil_post_rev_8_21_14_2_50_48_46]|uniref:protein O-GlcNAc transferase n=1 Tax=bacterium (Candidatus Blackallbacteria) CG17_big_fil_post_rev_8_21_14_2_50_48_46 TaxID=2014261 RepID=A0A2M7GAQ3_9BACT|nr:MAG: hypothetical protein COW64_26525 [bacterium (Candidatus Blackallbacteria) CG18_big_fil_WC_8_21_14_2_50_49_26]PIW19232.1 MAG: hypothetical protein COW36_02135 [bacterium (Candidatus Blackallbacteria) CG17_big_fil_post_rev_8_21_14_2_50_48_46]PIW45418.1 MAG: hypothetical protein COW20_20005 [bacterium (Candidatus Blackallbacteria) CG13_big_fil_rev_8_21_14_2_50_49_14]